MLMDILMEAFMSMDNESLDYVLESCDAEELEIISDAMEARFEDGPTIVPDKHAMYDNLSDKHYFKPKYSAGPNKQDVEIAKRLYDPNNKGHKSAKRLILAQIRNKDHKNAIENNRKHYKEVAKYNKFFEANKDNPAAMDEMEKRYDDYLDRRKKRCALLHNTRSAIRSDRNKLRSMDCDT